MYITDIYPLNQPYHRCGEMIEKRSIDIPKELFWGAKFFSMDYCPECDVFMFHHFEKGKPDFESKDSDVVVKYLGTLFGKDLKA